MTKTVALILATLVQVGLLVLLALNWAQRGRRYVLLGDVLLVSIVPASVFISHDNLFLTFLGGGGLLVGGLALRIVGERMGEHTGG